MRLYLPLIATLPFTTGTLLPNPSPLQAIFSNPSESTFTIPSAKDSAVLARRILNLTPLGTLSSSFPHQDTAQPVHDARPHDLSGIAIGLMDYIADCEFSGNPTILAINIATTFRNAAQGSNVSLALQWTPPYPPSSRISSSRKDPVPYSAANLPRFSLLGHLEKMSEEDVEANGIKECFVKTHPDAKYWLPGNRIHRAEWMRLVVDGIYWIGGFGDRAYIGWIAVDVYRNVTTEQWESVRLPGEKKGWKEWAVDMFGSFEL